MESFDRVGAFHVAKLAQQAKRYDDMAKAMKRVANIGVNLTAEDAKLLLIAYEKMIESRRASWKILSSILEKENTMACENTKTTLEYMLIVRNEIEEICAQVFSLMDFLMREDRDNYKPTDDIFCLQMKGDFSRYLAEVKPSGSTERKEANDQSLNAYKDAIGVASVQVPPTHPGRLDLALNYAVLHFDIFASRLEAAEIARQAYGQAYDEARPDFSGMNEDSKKLMQLLRDKIIQWDPNGIPPAAA